MIQTIDTVLLVVLLLNILFGYLKGFIRSVVLNLNLIASFTIAFMFVGTLYTFLINETDLLSWTTRRLFDLLFNSPSLNIIPTAQNYQSEIKELLSILNFTGLLVDLILSFLSFVIGIIGMMIAEALAQIVLYLISFFLILLSTFLVVTYISLKIYKYMVDKYNFGLIDSLLGTAFGFVKSLLLIEFILFPFIIASLIFPSLKDYFSNDLFAQTQGFSILKLFYEQTLIMVEFKFDGIRYFLYLFEEISKISI
jgi:uncharacterized membrane protein required for colicin V production